MSGHRRCCCNATGGPCCDGSRLCAPPAPTAPGTSNVQTVRYDRVVERTGQPTSERHEAAQLDIGCGTFNWQIGAGGMHVSRDEVLANFPSSPGLKRWVQLRFGESGVGGVFTIYWRPDATWWEFGSFNQANPSDPDNELAASVSACGRSATFERTNRLTPTFVVHTTSEVSIEGSLLRCPETLAMGAGGCGCKGKATATT